jgi:hypothetical protein
MGMGPQGIGAAVVLSDQCGSNMAGGRNKGTQQARVAGQQAGQQGGPPTSSWSRYFSVIVMASFWGCSQQRQVQAGKRSRREALR